ncbi:MAG: PIN domain-containing protein [Chloroflexota bacterium]|nr:MAG: PIN domain-containing protein [Chloroflexota bacterium]
MPFVLDASVAMSWCFRDEVNSRATRVLDRIDEESAIVPAIWPLEVANALRYGERNARLTSSEVAQFMDLVNRLPIEVESTPFGRATGPILQIARDHRLTTYDAAYLELAARLAAPLATDDLAMRGAAMRMGVALID